MQTSDLNLILLVVLVAVILALLFIVESKFAAREEESYRLIDEADRAPGVREWYES